MSFNIHMRVSGKHLHLLLILRALYTHTSCQMTELLIWQQVLKTCNNKHFHTPSLQFLFEREVTVFSKCHVFSARTPDTLETCNMPHLLDYQEDTSFSCPERKVTQMQYHSVNPQDTQHTISIMAMTRYRERIQSLIRKKGT